MQKTGKDGPNGGKFEGHFEEEVSGLESMRNYQAHDFMTKRMDRYLSALKQSVRHFTRWDILYDFIIVLSLLNLTHDLIYRIGGRSIVSGAMSVGMISAFTLYFSRLRDATDLLLSIPKKALWQGFRKTG
ncbi:ABC transporter transmembrane domain-containing protein [Peptoniphilaceae bacterium SGI.137]